MEPLQQQQPQIDFDLSWIHPRERFPFWHDVGSLVQRPAQERYQEPASLMVRAKILSLGEIVMGQMTSSPQYYLIRLQPPRSCDRPLEWYKNTSTGHVRQPHPVSARDVPSPVHGALRHRREVRGRP